MSVLRKGVDKDHRTLNWVLILYQYIYILKNQVFVISTPQKPCVNRIDLQAPTLAGLPRADPGAGSPSCTIPLHIHHATKIYI